MLTIGIDRPPVTFAANGEYVVSGGTRGVQVWRVEDGKLLATMEAEQVQCVAFSKDGKWIAAGTFWGDVMVWDAKIYKQIFTTWKIDDVIRGVDFSPNSSRLVALGDHTATVWNIATRELVVRLLHYKHSLLAAKYSPNGDRIATATQSSVRVYDSNNGHLLIDIPVQVTTRYNTGLLWSNNDLFVISDGKIKQIQIDTSTGSTIWESPDASNPSCIAIPRHGEFIACSANRTVTFWDTSTHTPCGLVHHPRDIYSIALSPDGRFLAIGGEDEKITFKRLSRITVSIVSFNWIMASEQPPCSVAIPRNLTFRSTTLRSNACDNGTMRSPMPKRYLPPVPIYTETLTHQYSAIRHELHRKEFITARQSQEACRISSVRHRVRTPSFNSRWVSPSHQGEYSLHRHLVAPQLPILYRLSSYVWPEIMTTRYRA